MSRNIGLRVPSLEPGLGEGHIAKHLVAGSLQPEEATWEPFPMSSPNMGGAIGVRGIIGWTVAESGELGGPIFGYRS